MPTGHPLFKSADLSTIKPNSWLGYFGLYFAGVCMGVADIIPGISGGTIAFILGVYPGLILSLNSLNKDAFIQLLSFRFKAFFRSVGWEFLMTLVLGIATSLVLLAAVIDHLLNQPESRAFLYAGFSGLVLASVLFFSRQIKKWCASYVAAFILGALIAFFLTVYLTKSGSEELFTYSSTMPWVQPMLFFSGIAAICAVLLPGISGSYVLTIIGVYPLVIGALADFVAAIKQMSWDPNAFLVLFNFGLGVLLGAILFARFIRWLFEKGPEYAISLLTGFMLGAMPAVWPFWHYREVVNPLKLQGGVKLIPTSAYFPDLSSLFFWQVLGCAAVGFCAVFLLEATVKKLKAGIKDPMQFQSMCRGTNS